MAPIRTSYVVSVHERGGPAIVEEVRTGRKARLGSLRDAGAQIEQWLREPKLVAADRAQERR